MTENNKSWQMGILAFLVVALWGVTFVSFTVALEHFTPAQIMFLRCVIAYLSLLVIYPKFHKSEGLKQELLLLAAGASGTTMYVILTNTALMSTATSNVSVLSSLSPIFTALLLPLFIKKARVLTRVLIGFAVAFMGAFFISTAGDFTMKLSFLGDMLAIGSAVAWAIYSLILRKIQSPYSQFYITRRIFLYGIITVIPVLLIQGDPIDIAALSKPEVILNLLFLGLVAYTGCHAGWALVIKKMGSVWTSQFTYLTPIVTMIFSFIILGDVIDIYMIIGTVLILCGVAVADGKFSKKGSQVSLAAAEGIENTSGEAIVTASKSA